MWKKHTGLRGPCRMNTERMRAYRGDRLRLRASQQLDQMRWSVICSRSLAAGSLVDIVVGRTVVQMVRKGNLGVSNL